jgi:ParB family chromosome partitioning protein
MKQRNLNRSFHSPDIPLATLRRNPAPAPVSPAQEPEGAAKADDAAPVSDAGSQSAETSPPPALSPAAPASSNFILDDKEGKNAGVFYDEVEISLDLIDPNPFAPRTIYTPAMLKSRADEIRDQGQRDPIHVIKNPDAPGRYIIADGWTRVQGCIEHNGASKLVARVHNGLSVQDAAWLGYQQNEEREQLTDYDRAAFFASMQDQGMSTREIAAMTSVSQSTVVQFSSFKKLDPDVLEVVLQSPSTFGYSVAFQLLKAQTRLGVNKAVQLAKSIAEGKLSRRGLQDLIAKIEAQGGEVEERPKPAPSAILKFNGGRFVRKGNAFSMHIEIEEEKIQSFEEEFKALLSKYAEIQAKALG